MSQVKAIETRYKGYRFRSRLEARWAVFFDAMDIRWEYEPQGFEINCGYMDDADQAGDSEPSQKVMRYLPDFYLVDSKTWVEVKGSLDECSNEYLDMIGWAIDWGGQLPDVRESVGTSRGLLWLGAIPEERLCHYGPPTHVIFQHSGAGWVNYCAFMPDGSLEVDRELNNGFDSSCQAGSEIRAALADAMYSKDKYYRLSRSCDPKLRAAYRTARTARFEFGETPR